MYIDYSDVMNIDKHYKLSNELGSIAAIEYGFVCLKNGDFFAAHEKFYDYFTFPDVDCDIYLGRLLLEHLCKNVNELAQLGIPINENKNYILLLENSDDSYKKSIDMLSNAVLMGTNFHILKYTIDKKNKFLASKWINHYKESVDSNDEFAKLHNWLLEKIDCNYNLHPEFPGVLQKMYCLFDELLDKYRFVVNQNNFEVLENIIKSNKLILTEYYCKVMDTLLEKMQEKFANTVPNKKQEPVLFASSKKHSSYLDDMRNFLMNKGLKFIPKENSEDNYQYLGYSYENIWANPVAAYSKKVSNEIIINNIDGISSSIGERWLILATKLWNSPHGFDKSVYDKMCLFFDEAKRHAVDNNIYDDCVNNVINDIKCKENITEEDLYYIIKYDSKNSSQIWQYIKLKTKNFTRILNVDYITFKGIDEITPNTKPRKIDITFIDSLILQANNNIKKINDEINDAIHELQPFIDIIITNNDAQVVEFTKQWENYVNLLNAKRIECESILKDKLALYEQKRLLIIKRNQTPFIFKWLK